MNATEIPIPNPCTADWTTMTLADRGRFCGDCRKVVRELAQMSERDARAMLASPPTEGLCVRYIHDAEGEIVFRADVLPAARLVRRVATAALALTLPLAAGCATTGEPAGARPPSMGGVQPSVMPAMMGAPPVLPVEHADAGGAIGDEGEVMGEPESRPR